MRSVHRTRLLSTQASELKEYSVIYTDRAKNLMAGSFSQAFKDISSELNAVYNSHKCIMIPGSGTYAMEAVAGQFARTKNELDYKPCMVIRNGFFSFRWSDIWSFLYPATDETSPELVVVKAQAVAECPDNKPQFRPPSVEQAIAQIKNEQPCVVFVPHVETSAGIGLSDTYIRQLAKATHDACPDAIFVLDGIAAGNKWANMEDLGVDVYITAPQKGWTGPACVGIAMMNERACDIMEKRNTAHGSPRGRSFCCNLGKWSTVADAYAAPGGFMYHTTLPTDSLMDFNRVIQETKEFGYDECKKRMFELGRDIRDVLSDHGFKSVAAEECEAYSVVVAYNRDEEDGALVGKFKAEGIQIAGGVPLKIDEPWESFAAPPTFRLGLFGLDKLKDVGQTVSIFKDSLDRICK
jgi:aspartate aminotransferase-like enzyme